MQVLISCPSEKIPTKKYGGIEPVILSLGKALIKQNQSVSYLVVKGSSCPFTNAIEYNPEISINTQIPDYIDIVHDNSLISETIKKPSLFIMHGNNLTNDVKDIYSVFSTKNYVNRHNANTYVYNGLDWEDYPKANLNLERNYYLFLGKAS